MKEIGIGFGIVVGIGVIAIFMTFSLGPETSILWLRLGISTAVVFGLLAWDRRKSPAQSWFRLSLLALLHLAVWYWVLREFAPRTAILAATMTAEYFLLNRLLRSSPQ